MKAFHLATVFLIGAFLFSPFAFGQHQDNPTLTTAQTQAVLDYYQKLSLKNASPAQLVANRDYWRRLESPTLVVVLKYVQKAATTGETTHFEYLVFQPDGGVKKVGSELYDRDGFTEARLIYLAKGRETEHRVERGKNSPQEIEEFVGHPINKPPHPPHLHNTDGSKLWLATTKNQSYYLDGVSGFCLVSDFQSLECFGHVKKPAALRI